MAAPAGAAGRHVQASLVSETESIQPGQRLLVGIRLQMDEGWHTYWKNPADSGLPDTHVLAASGGARGGPAPVAAARAARDPAPRQLRLRA